VTTAAAAAAADAAVGTAAPPLSGAQVERAFPFHLWLDAELRLLGAGSSLRRAMPGLRLGEPLSAQFEVRRPRQATSLDDWRRHGTDLCTLRALGDVSLTLRGNAETLADGSLLLLVSPVLTSLEDVRALGLGFNDFAKHDAAGELLLLARSTQMSAQDTERLAQRLKARSEQLDSILELGQNGVIAFGRDGHVQQVNGALLRLLGLPRAAARGMALPAFQAHLTGLLERGQRGTDLARLQPEAGPTTLRLAAPRPAVVQLTMQTGAEGGQVFYWRDMTAESEVDRMKSEFLSTAAHELRTPMVSIFGFTELLLHRTLSEPKQRDVLQTIHRQSALLIRMVNELLDLARIEARQGKDLVREPLCLKDLVQDNVEGLRGALDRHAIEVDLAHGDAMLLLDAGKTAQALTNVLSNAVKYSPEGGEIHLSSIAGTIDGDPAIGLRITDQGIGMTPAQAARVFERFFRADPSGNIPGTGLGMSLVKEIVELQGGRVAIESRPARGTTVTLWFPAMAAAPVARVTEPAPA
jgi:signal transduction histidine kinase